MRNKEISVPLISRELEFIARHVDEADAIYLKTFKVEESLQTLTDTVYERANDNACRLLNEVARAISRGTEGIICIDWKESPRRDYWDIDGPASIPLGRKKGVGSVGLNIGSGKEGFRLICSVWGRGGLGGRRELATITKKKVCDVVVASHQPKNYPGWSGSDDAVIWLSEKLTVKTKHDLLDKISERAKFFFEIATPVLEKLADRDRAK